MSSTKISPISSNEDPHGIDLESSVEFSKNEESSSVSPPPPASKKSSTSSGDSSSSSSNKKLGWKRIQQKTELIVEEIQNEKKHGKKSRKKRVSSIEKLASASGAITEQRDRSHRITEAIDAIRHESIERLHAKKHAKRKKDAEESATNTSHTTTWWNICKTITIHPKSTWKQTWDVCILLLVVFSSVQIPLLLAFPDMTPLDTYVRGLLLLLSSSSSFNKNEFAS